MRFVYVLCGCLPTIVAEVSGCGGDHVPGKLQNSVRPFTEVSDACLMPDVVGLSQQPGEVGSEDLYHLTSGKVETEFEIQPCALF